MERCGNTKEEETSKKDVQGQSTHQVIKTGLKFPFFKARFGLSFPIVFIKRKFGRQCPASKTTQNILQVLCQVW